MPKPTTRAPPDLRRLRREKVLVGIMSAFAHCAFAARMTALRIRVCVPQRQRWMARLLFTCSSVGFGLFLSSSVAAITMPVVQYPHCAACSAMNAA